MASPRVVLNCRHEALFDPPAVVGDEVYCRRCCRYRYVDKELTGMIRANCRQCPYTRFYGVDEGLANKGAAKHSLRKPTHEIDIERDGAVIRTVSMREQESLGFVVETLKEQQDRWTRKVVEDFVKQVDLCDSSLNELCRSGES